MLQSLKDLLKTASRAELRLCNDCGLPMERFTTQFFFEDEVLEVLLPFCPRCAALPMQDRIAS
jgi:hypothetical protein